MSNLNSIIEIECTKGQTENILVTKSNIEEVRNFINGKKWKYIFYGAVDVKNTAKS